MPVPVYFADFADHVLRTISDPTICPNGIVPGSVIRTQFKGIDLLETLNALKKSGKVAYHRMITYDDYHVVLTIDGYNHALELQTSMRVPNQYSFDFDAPSL